MLEKSIEGVSGGADQNIADIEAVVAGAQAEPEQGAEIPPAPVPEVDALEQAKAKARGIVGFLQGVFKFADARINYPEKTYRDAELRLAPALAKHQLSESAALKYVEEVDAAAFVGELVWRSAADVLGLRRQDAAKAAAQAAAVQEGIQQGVRADGDKS
jgi:hypothetical protein